MRFIGGGVGIKDEIFFVEVRFIQGRSASPNLATKAEHRLG
jgi:hypothetical protein